MQSDIKKYISYQIKVQQDILRKYTHSPNDTLYQKRHSFQEIMGYIQAFLSQKPEARNGLIMYGLRGIGKTTLMAQVMTHLMEENQQSINFLFIFFNDVKEKLSVSLEEVLSAYQDLLNQPFEKLDKPTLIFIDEIQYSTHWSETVRALLDRTTKLFLFCTGSSAIELKIDANRDLARRIAKIRLYPLKFTEYQLLKNHCNPRKGLSQKLDKILYQSQDAQQVFDSLKDNQNAVKHEWLKYNQAGNREHPNLFDNVDFQSQSIDLYLDRGAIPFILHDSQHVAYNYIREVADKVIRVDIKNMANLEVDTIMGINRILFIIASSTGSYFSLDSLSKNLTISRTKLIDVLDFLEKSELLIKVPAYGRELKQTRKSPGYHFMCPSIRSAYYSIVGNPLTSETKKGQLLEDAASMYYHQKFINLGLGGLAYPYPAKEGLCDFILQPVGHRRIALEFSLTSNLSQKNQQIQKTMKKIECKYGLVFSNDSELHIAQSVVFVPLGYFFLT